MMSVTKSKKCPICNQPYSQNQKQCLQCSWDLTLDNDRFLSAEQSLKVHISARKIYRYLEKYRNTVRDMHQKIQEYQEKEASLIDANDRLKQEVKQLKKLPLQIFELELQIDKLQLQIEQLTTQKGENQIKVDCNLEEDLIDRIDRNTNFLAENGIQVTPTKKTLEDIYLNTVKEIIFAPDNHHDYWVMELESGVYCLLPDEKLDIRRNLKAIKHFFELLDYQDNSSSSKSWQVIKSARVDKINLQEWKFKTKGILQF